MHDARDAEDKRLLQEGEHKLLLAGYFHPVREQCFIALRNQDAADEVTQRVFLRLLNELRAAKNYRVPFRVVAWMVTKWTLRSFYPAAKHDATLPEGWDPEAPDAYAEWEDMHDLGMLLADLPPRQQQVLGLAYGEGLSLAQIAERLGIKRNAVDQALHNGHKRLAERHRG
jgi:RNA polymerase sigma factor (sigma-70 family)